MWKRLKQRQIWNRHSRQRKKLSLKHPLQYLFLEITRRCNIHCVYCGSNCTPAGAGDQEMSAEQWCAVIEQIAQDFNARKIMVAVTGGEPLMKKGVFDIFAALRRCGFPFGMVTNGTLIDSAMAKRIVDSGIGSISLSLDAPPTVNDSLRGEGVAAKVISAIENLRAKGFYGKLEIISTLTKPAVAHLDEMRRYISEHRVPLWRVAPVMPIGRAAEKRQELVPGPAEIKNILDFVTAARADEWMPHPEFGEEGYVGDDYEGLVRPYLCQCRAGVSIAGIRCDGRIGACPEISDYFLQGDIKTQRLKTVWEEGFQIFRDRSWTKQHECAKCSAFSRCQGGAMHLYQDASTPILRCFHLQLQNSVTPQ